MPARRRWPPGARSRARCARRAFVASDVRRRGQLCTAANPPGIHLRIGQGCSDKRSHFFEFSIGDERAEVTPRDVRADDHAALAVPLDVLQRGARVPPVHGRPFHAAQLYPPLPVSGHPAARSAAAPGIRGQSGRVVRRGERIGHYSVPGIIGLGMAIRNSSGTVLGVIATSSIDTRMTRNDQQLAALSIERHVEQVQSSLDNLYASRSLC